MNDRLNPTHRPPRSASRAGGRGGRGDHEPLAPAVAAATSPTSARPATRPTLPRFRPSIGSTAIRRSEGGDRADQEDATRGSPRHAWPPRSRRSPMAASIVAASCAVRASPPAALRRSERCRWRSVRKAEAGPPPPPGAAVTIRKNVCTHCSVGCTVIAEVANGVWIGQEPGWDSPINRGSHCCKGAAVRDDVLSERRLRYPMKLVNGQWNRISWDQAIDEIGDKLHGDPRQVGTGIGLLARLRQVHQRGRLSQPQARRVLGNQQLRSPGAHLSLHHRRRRRQYLGLRRDDQQLQRHPQRQDHHGDGRQSGRGASGVAAAHSRRQGAQPRQHDRHRSADDAHRGARDRICPGAARHAHSDHLRDALAHLPERLGGQGIHPPARLRHGRDPQGGREVAARRGRARHRPAGGAGQAHRRDVRQAASRDPDLGDGADPVHRRHGQRPRRAASCCSPPATSATPAAAPTSSAATPTSRARPISASM